MSAMRAIIADTWRQSRQQVVFIIMIVLLALITVAIAVIVQPYERSDGKRDLTTIFDSKPDDNDGLSNAWLKQYSDDLHVSRGGTGDALGGGWDEYEAREKAVADAFEIGNKREPIDLATEVTAYFGVLLLFTVSLWLFIGACGPYFPQLLDGGAVDVVLAKPVTRLQLFMGKYLGGLALFTIALIGAGLLLFVALGIRTGSWCVSIFNGLPIIVFSAAVLFALIAWVGVQFRSSAVAIIIGYVFYAVIDTILGRMQLVQAAGGFRDIAWLNDSVEITGYVFPSFDLLRGSAMSAVLNVPTWKPWPILAGCGWILVSLSLAYNKFRRTDY